MFFTHLLLFLACLPCPAFASPTLPTAPCTARPIPTSNTTIDDVSPAAPAAAALITIPPAAHTAAPAAPAKFVQTTYYSCVTMGTYSHCGWHQPILDASDNAAGHAAGPVRPGVLLGAGLLWMVMVMLL